MLIAVFVGCNYIEEDNLVAVPALSVLSISPANESKFNLSLNTITVTFTDDIYNAEFITNYYLSGSALGTLFIAAVSNVQSVYTLYLTGQPIIDGDLTLSISNVIDSYGTVLTDAIFDYHVWWDSSWSTRKKIIFDNSGQTTGLTDFPVLIKLDSSNIDYTKVNDSGQDLRFIGEGWVEPYVSR